MIDFLEKFGINSTYVLVLVGLGIGIYTFTLLDLQSNMVFSIMATTAPIWLPVVTFKLFYEAWLDYVRKDFDLAQGRVTLEIKLPQEIFKSPEAMELVLNQLFQKAGADNHIQTYWDGKHAPLYSLELVSRGGDVRFYINLPKKKFKNLAETQLYAQYPGIEVHELDVDYTAEIVWDPNKYNCMAFHYGLTKADAYPIKTYIEYGLQNMPKEEEKINSTSANPPQTNQINDKNQTIEAEEPNNKVGSSWIVGLILIILIVIEGVIYLINLKKK